MKKYSPFKIFVITSHKCELCKMKFSLKQKFITGFTLVETIIYVAVFAMISIALVQLTISINQTYAAIKSTQALEVSASDSLNRMSHDIRNSTSVIMGDSSVFGVSPGRLSLSYKDSTGALRTVEYYLDSSNMLQVKENNISMGKLTASSTPVSNLIFTLINTGNSTAIKIDMSLETQKNKATTTESFHSTYILRGSY